MTTPSENCKGKMESRLTSSSMINDIDLDKKNKDSCITTSRKIKYQGYATNYGGKWDLRASQMVEEFENSGHPDSGKAK